MPLRSAHLHTYPWQYGTYFWCDTYLVTPILRLWRFRKSDIECVILAGRFTFLVRSRRHHDIGGPPKDFGARSARFFEDFNESLPEYLNFFLVSTGHGQILSSQKPKTLPRFLMPMILNGGPRVSGSLLTYPLRRVQSASEGLPYLLTPCLLKLNFIASNLHTLQPPCASRLPPLRLNRTLRCPLHTSPEALSHAPAVAGLGALRAL